MTKDELVFGVCYEDGDITSTSYNIVFGDKKVWENTKDPKCALISEDNKELKSLISILKTKRKQKKDDPAYLEEWVETHNNMRIPTIWTCYEWHGDDEIPNELINYVKSFGFNNYSEEFGYKVEKILK